MKRTLLATLVCFSVAAAGQESSSGSSGGMTSVLSGKALGNLYPCGSNYYTVPAMGLLFGLTYRL